MYIVVAPPVFNAQPRAASRILNNVCGISSTTVRRVRTESCTFRSWTAVATNACENIATPRSAVGTPVGKLPARNSVVIDHAGNANPRRRPRHDIIARHIQVYPGRNYSGSSPSPVLRLSRLFPKRPGRRRSVCLCPRLREPGRLANVKTSGLRTEQLFLVNIKRARPRFV